MRGAGPSTLPAPRPLCQLHFKKQDKTEHPSGETYSKTTPAHTALPQLLERPEGETVLWGTDLQRPICPNFV